MKGSIASCLKLVAIDADGLDTENIDTFAQLIKSWAEAPAEIVQCITLLEEDMVDFLQGRIGLFFVVF